VAARGQEALGILGGTFNPPHLGHLAAAEHAVAELGLAHVELMPAHTPPHKAAARADPGPAHRLRMCELAAGERKRVQACALEIERGGVSFTVDTLRDIHARSPHAELTFIVGADIARTLPSWREPRALLQLADLAVVARDGTERRAVVAALGELLPGSGAGDRRGPLRWLAMPEVPISSSLVRARVAAGLPVENLVGPGVSGYIRAHGLYRAARPQAPA
jgi:nicotinate-nucleotide adenylyltransferase